MDILTPIYGIMMQIIIVKHVDVIPNLEEVSIDKQVLYKRYFETRLFSKI